MLCKTCYISSILESFTLLRIKRKIKAGKKVGKSLENGESKGSGRQKIDIGCGLRFYDSPELLNKGGDV